MTKSLFLTIIFYQRKKGEFFACKQLFDTGESIFAKARIEVMKRTKPYISSKTLLNIHHKLVTQYLDYPHCGIHLVECCKKNITKTSRQRSQSYRWVNYETRPCIGNLESLGWKTLDKRHLQHNAALMYKILNDHSAPKLLSCLKTTV